MAGPFDDLPEVGGKKKVQPAGTPFGDLPDAAPAAPPRTWQERLARGREAAAAGTRKGWEGALGGVGDLPEMAEGGASWLATQANKVLPEAMQPDPAAVGKTAATIARGPGAMLASALQAAGIIGPDTAELAQVEAPGAADIHAATSKLIGPTTFKPENRLESGIETGAALMPALLGPGKGGGVTRFGTRVVAPTVALEGTDVYTDDLVKRGVITPETATAMKVLATAVAGGGASALEGNAKLAAAAQQLSSSSRGVRELARLVEASGLSPQEARAKLTELGVDATMMDVGPPMLSAGMDVSTRPGAGKAIVQNAMTEREAGAGARLDAAREAALGPEVNRVDVLAALKDRASEVGAKYPAAKANQSRLGNLQSIAAELDTELSTARGGMKGTLQKVRDMLNDPRIKSGDLDPTSEGIHAIRIELDNMIKEAAPGSPAYARLTDYRKRIDAELKDIAPDIKALDAERKQIGDEERAFEAGEELLTKGKEAQSPAEFRKAWDTLGDAEKAKTVEGASRYVSRQLGLSANERQQLKTLFGGDWNEGKLRTLIGDEKATAFMQAMEREDTFRNTYNKIVQNSRTPEAIGERGGGGGITEGAAEAGLIAGGASLSPKIGVGVAAGTILKNAVGKVLGQGGRNEKLRAELAPLLVSGRHDDLIRALTLAQRKGAVLPNAAIAALLARQEELGNR